MTMMSADKQRVCFVWILPQILQSCQNQRQGRIALPRLDSDDDKDDNFDGVADIHIMINCVLVCHKKQQQGYIALPRLGRDDDECDADGDADIHIMIILLFVCHKHQGQGRIHSFTSAW